jgi:hypothetical protein
MLDSIIRFVSSAAASLVSAPDVFVGQVVSVSRSHNDQRETVEGTVRSIDRERDGRLGVLVESAPDQSRTRDGLWIFAVWKPGYGWLVAHREWSRHGSR